MVKSLIKNKLLSVNILFSSFIILILFLLFVLSLQIPLRGDEPFHYRQIRLFLKGNYKIEPWLTVIPGAHLFLAAVSKLTGLKTLMGTRIINFTIGLMSISIFYLIAKKLDGKSAFLKTAIFIFLPFLFPYRYLLYTENISTFLILAALLALVKNSYLLSGFFSLLSLFARQSNIIFLVFFFSLGLLKTGKRLNKDFLFHFFFFIFGIILFILFVILNQGITLGITRDAHPFFMTVGNLYLFLFSFLILFYPLYFAKKDRVRKIFKTRSVTLISIFFILLNSSFFVNYHTWNKTPDYLRNLLFITLENNFILRGIFFLMITFSIVTLANIRFYQKRFYLLYPFSFLALSSSSLVEPRYAILPFTLFILFWKESDNKIFMKIFILHIVFSLIFFKLVLFDNFHI